MSQSAAPTVDFIPIPDGQDNPPIFYAAGAGTEAMASVNAGNSAAMDVGGGGVNLGFKVALDAEGQDTAAYLTRHTAILGQIKGDGTTVMTWPAGQDNPTSLIYALADGYVTSASGHRRGLCLIEIFGTANLPHGNAMNAAMVYACPPYGGDFASDTDFLDAIEAAAGLIVRAMRGYNAIAAQHGAPVLGALRLCLMSSGIYNRQPKVPNDAIAGRIHAGLMAELGKDAGGIVRLELPVSGDPAKPLFDSLEPSSAAPAAG